MFAEKHYPEMLIPEELDHYLARGWYRMGQTIFTTHFLCFDEQFFSAIWIRLPLAGYQFRKSLRKVLRRGRRDFRIRFQPARLGLEKEKLYQRYRAAFPGMLAPSLKDSLLDGDEFNIFNTYEVTVHHGEKLVAFSFFDLGRTGAASIIGVYDPEYNQYSLGIFTMLLEIAFVQERGFTHFYPGYIVPGYHRFDYKLRIGRPQEVEFYDLGLRNWRPYAELQPAEVPVTKMKDRLLMLETQLRAARVPAKLQYYPLFEANLFGFWQAPYFDYPLFLRILPDRKLSPYLIVVYDVREETYKLIYCSPFDDLQFYFNDSFTRAFRGDRFFLELILVEKDILHSPEPEELVNALGQLAS